MKLAGALLAFLGCCAAGAVRASAARRRLDALSALCEALCLMKSELGTRLSTIPDMAERASGQTRGTVKDFFTALSARMDELGHVELAQLWAECAAAELSVLAGAEAREFAALGAVLGRCDADMQLAAISACEAYLRAALEHARGDYPQQRRLSLGIAAAAGALLVIVFI